MAALDKHETRGADNLLSIISAEKPGFSLWEILERIPDIFFFLPPEQTKTLGSPGALCGEMTCLSVCWAPSFRGLMIHRWVRTAAGNKSVSGTWLGKDERDWEREEARF